MRLDKFLQTSRLVKRRVLAAKMCNAGRVRLNDQPAKAGRQVSVGDRIGVSFGKGASLLCEVAHVPRGGVRKDQASSLFRVISRTPNAAEGAAEDAAKDAV